MKFFLISIFLCLPLLLWAQSGPDVNITGSYTAVLYDPATPPNHPKNKLPIHNAMSYPAHPLLRRHRE